MAKEETKKKTTTKKTEPPKAPTSGSLFAGLFD
jgi:hypothetical protein